MSARDDWRTLDFWFAGARGPRHANHATRLDARPMRLITGLREVSLTPVTNVSDGLGRRSGVPRVGKTTPLFSGAHDSRSAMRSKVQRRPQERRVAVLPRRSAQSNGAVMPMPRIGPVSLAPRTRVLRPPPTSLPPQGTTLTLSRSSDGSCRAARLH